MFKVNVYRCGALSWIVVPSGHAQVCWRLGRVTIENKSFWKVQVLAIEIKMINWYSIHFVQYSRTINVLCIFCGLRFMLSTVPKFSTTSIK